MNENEGPHIQSVLFGMDSVEISYIEPRDIERSKKTGINRIKTVMIPNSVLAEELGNELSDVVESLGRMVDEADRIDRLARG